jgi:hypothetical protein
MPRKVARPHYTLPYLPITNPRARSADRARLNMHLPLSDSLKRTIRTLVFISLSGVGIVTFRITQTELWDYVTIPRANWYHTLRITHRKSLDSITPTLVKTL